MTKFTLDTFPIGQVWVRICYFTYPRLLKLFPDREAR